MKMNELNCEQNYSQKTLHLQESHLLVEILESLHWCTSNLFICIFSSFKNFSIWNLLCWTVRENKPNWLLPPNCEAIVTKFVKCSLPFPLMMPALSYILLRKWPYIHFQYVITKQFLQNFKHYCFVQMPAASNFKSFLYYLLLFSYIPRILLFLSEHSPVLLWILMVKLDLFQLTISRQFLWILLHKSCERHHYLSGITHC